VATLQQLDLGDPEARVVAGVRELVAEFNATTELLEHLALVDQEHVRGQIAWLRKHRKPLWDELRPVILESWKRNYPQALEHRVQAAITAKHMHRDWLDYQNRIQRRNR
jgi:hypothetical protein